MDVKAKTRYLPISSTKLRLVCDQIRGMDADQALIVLKFMPHKGADMAYRLISSAVANAEENFELNRQDMFIAEINADEGPTQRRIKAGARGRYKPRLKRSSHLSVVLREYDYSHLTASEEIDTDGA